MFLKLLPVPHFPDTHYELSENSRNQKCRLSFRTTMCLLTFRGKGWEEIYQNVHIVSLQVVFFILFSLFPSEHI